jgi:hypothetical protein
LSDASGVNLHACAPKGRDGAYGRAALATRPMCSSDPVIVAGPASW